MSSKSATVLVIFSVAVIAFCLANVFAAMTGPISILPNESESGGILDNLSVLTDSDNNNYQQSYGYDDSYDYSSSSSDSHTEDSQVETTTDNSQESKTTSDDSKVETTTDSDSSNQDSGASNDKTEVN